MSRTPHPGASKPPPQSPKQLTISEQKVKVPVLQPPPPLVEVNHLMRHIDRAPPGDMARRSRTPQPREELTRHKSKRNFFEDAFSDNPLSLARERVHGDAIVLAEVKTNVRDEFTFITELAYHLSTRYQRPVSSVVVTLRHGACMFWGGSFDPAYVMSVVALPSQLQPTTNRRNAALIQRHMEETLGVRPARGVLRFVPVAEEGWVCGGRTVAGEVEALERGVGRGVGGGGEGGELAAAATSIAALRPASTTVGLPTPELTPPGSGDEGLSRMPEARPKKEQGSEAGAASHSPQRKAAQRKKSFVATIFGRSGSKPLYDASLPAIADEA
ncbi:hypothetical protein CHGG_02953 [Chaetomium globosum CBS 148.51]|uniref:L-dopachrome isomerase n=1 Tax=Chaetomium globosum (strain ATCC 6205 / CBS 148.51 / DSM 1962 / NBRC 6347 / NRRL 1970) TaxID=306901 RepID=Q2HA01_CHAGB|nr:uncharacterized protein CHGG_02953 [Chaetomium globosum CBS 148.51]EAQ91018.1 hypothetical protein CHGG_02953 [Chaetomium globosum CBS 148.51]